MQFHPRIGGAIGIAIGVGFIAITLYTVSTKGYFYEAPCIGGPLVLPISFAYLVLPARYLSKPKEWNTSVDNSKLNVTTLGKVLFVIGILLGIAFYLYMRNDTTRGNVLIVMGFLLGIVFYWYMRGRRDNV